MMDTYDLISNNTGLSFFDTFNEKYSNQAVKLCPLLSKFHINAIHHYDSFYLDKIGFNSSDTFASYIYKNEDDASSTYAEIVVNEDTCNRFSLTEDEKHAAIAHEIGHIIYFFMEDRDDVQGIALEIRCDNIACRMGLGDSLLSMLKKFVASNVFSEDIKMGMYLRILEITRFLSPCVIG